jgi:hypothetical protein
VNLRRRLAAEWNAHLYYTLRFEFSRYLRALRV